MGTSSLALAAAGLLSLSLLSLAAAANAAAAPIAIDPTAQNPDALAAAVFRHEQARDLEQAPTPVRGETEAANDAADDVRAIAERLPRSNLPETDHDVAVVHGDDESRRV